MKLMFLLAVLSFQYLFQVPAQAGDSAHGGQKCQAKFEERREDIANWIQAGADSVANGTEPVGSALLNFTKSSANLSTYNKVMLAEIELTERGRDQDAIGCTDNPEAVKVNGQYKTCKAFGTSSKPHILCYSGKLQNGKWTGGFMGSSEDDQYWYAHHELAVLSGFEDQDGQNSNYLLSDQLTGRSGNRGFIVTETVRKLAIKPAQAPKKSADCPSVKLENHVYLAQQNFISSLDSTAHKIASWKYGDSQSIVIYNSEGLFVGYFKPSGFEDIIGVYDCTYNPISYLRSDDYQNIYRSEVSDMAGARAQTFTEVSELSSFSYDQYLAIKNLLGGKAVSRYWFDHGTGYGELKTAGDSAAGVEWKNICRNDTEPGCRRPKLAIGEITFSQEGKLNALEALAISLLEMNNKALVFYESIYGTGPTSLSFPFPKHL